MAAVEQLPPTHSASQRARLLSGLPVIALHVIETCADDPPRDQPRAFLEALRASLGVATQREPEQEVL